MRTNPDVFMNNWIDYLSRCSMTELRRWLEETSPHHPNNNMVWLHDYILEEIAHRIEVCDT